MWFCFEKKSSSEAVSSLGLWGAVMRFNAAKLLPIQTRRRRRRRRDKRKKMTGRAKRKPKSSQVILLLLWPPLLGCGDVRLKAGFSRRGAVLRVVVMATPNFCWTLWAEVFGTLSEQQRSDDNMAAALLTGTAKALVHWRPPLAAHSVSTMNATRKSAALSHGP